MRCESAAHGWISEYGRRVVHDVVQRRYRSREILCVVIVSVWVK